MIVVTKPPKRSWKDWADFKMTAWEKAAWTVVLFGSAWVIMTGLIAIAKTDDAMGGSVLGVLAAIIIGLFLIWGDKNVRETTAAVVIGFAVLASLIAFIFGLVFGFIWTSADVAHHLKAMT